MNCRTAIIAGGGIIGLACAHRLLRAGIATSIINPASACSSASWGNAGHLAVEQVEPLASQPSIRKALHQLFPGAGPIRAPLGEIRHWFPFFLRMAAASGNARFRAGKAALSSCMQRATPTWRAVLEEIGHPELLVECGHFVVWESSQTATLGKARWLAADIGPASFRDATAWELEHLASFVRQKIHGAIRFEGTGQFTDPGLLLDALNRSVEAAGGARITGLVTKVGSDTRGRAILETDDGTRHGADAVIIASGVASGRLLASTVRSHQSLPSVDTTSRLRAATGLTQCRPSYSRIAP